MIHIRAKLLQLLVSAVCIIPAASNTDDSDVQLTTSFTMSFGGNSTRKHPMMNGPMVAPNDHTACVACNAGSL